jgi:methylthioribose-1-phosphate isomerase
MSAPQTITWMGDAYGFVRLLDQTLLPATVAYRDCHAPEDVWEAIRQLRVRGAPAIGVAAAMGLVLGTRSLDPAAGEQFLAQVRRVANYLRTSRPTAVNLFWALDRMEARAARLIREGCRDVSQAAAALWREALSLAAEDRRTCRSIGEVGAVLIRDGMGVLTHCNAGALATTDYGTALAALFVAREQGRSFHVYADETRPLLQGARLTTWELIQRGISTTLICDNMTGQVMKEGRVQIVLVGADRIAANGDTANKIGTYGLAVLAAAHDIPFYVAAPLNTFDLTLPTGEAIPIEQRDPREVTHGFGSQTAPDGVGVYNPAFDVTPARLIHGIVTERGLIRPVMAETIREMFGKMG